VRIVGIDPGSAVLALATCLTDTGGLFDYELIAPKFPKRTRAQERYWPLICGVRQTEALTRQPDYVYIEEPIYAGSFTATMALGMMIGGLIVVLNDLGIPYSLVGNSTWKKQLIGRGNATKDEVQVWVRARFPEVPEGLRQDVYDAIAIAEWGRQRFTR